MPLISSTKRFVVFAITAFFIAVVGAVVLWPQPNALEESSAHVPISLPIDGAQWIASVSIPDPTKLNRPDIQKEMLSAVLDLKNSHSSDHRAVHLVGLVYSELKQSTEAEQHLRSSLDIHPNETQVRYDLAELLMATGRYEEALQVLEPGKRSGRERLDFVCLLADAQSQVGKLQAASETLNDGVRQFPQAAQVWRKIGAVQIQQEDYAKAQTSLRRAIELDTHNEQAYFALCQVLGILNKPTEAIEVRRALEIQQASRKETDSSFEVVHEASFRRFAASTFRSMAYLHDQFNEVTSATKSFGRSLEIDPSSVPTRLMFTSFLRKHHDLEKAIDLMRTVVHLQPDVFTNYINLASLCMEADSPAFAEATLRVASERGIDHGQAHLHFAKFLLLAGKADEAVAPARLAVRDMNSVEAMSVLMSALEKAGLSTEANQLRSKPQSTSSIP